MIRILAFVLLAVNAFAADPFLGTAMFRTTQVGDSVTQEFTYKVSAEIIRFETVTRGHLRIVLHDTRDGSTAILYPDMKIGQVRGGQGAMSMSMGGEPTFNPTGNKRTLLGYECEEWVNADDSTEVRVWTSPIPGGFFSFRNPLIDGGTAAYEIWCKAQGVFPLLVVVSEKGKEIGRTEALSVDRSPVDPSLFTIPSDFKMAKMTHGQH
jgi:hypothetical protein